MSRSKSKKTQDSNTVYYSESPGIETSKLVAEIEATPSIEQYYALFGNYCSEDFSFSKCFARLFSAGGLKKTEVLQRAHLNVPYGHEIIRGSKIPSRDKVIMIAVGLRATVEEAQLLLRHSGYNPLTPKNRRDALVMFAFTHSLDLDALNSLLEEQILPTFD